MESEEDGNRTPAFNPRPPLAIRACRADDPYGAMTAVRAFHGDGWLIAHLWDLLWCAP